MNLTILLSSAFLVCVCAVAAYPTETAPSDPVQPRWKIYKTAHFDICFRPGMEEMALKSASLAEDGYLRISTYLGYQSTAVRAIMVYPSGAELERDIAGMKLSPPGIDTGPFHPGRPMRVAFDGNLIDFRRRMTHALVHAIQRDILFHDPFSIGVTLLGPGRIPLWIWEGMADYIAGGFDAGSDSAMRYRIANGRYLPIGRLDTADPSTIGDEALALFSYLERRHGKNILAGIFRDLRDGTGVEGALQAATGMTIRQLDEDLLKFHKARYAGTREPAGRELRAARGSRGTQCVNPAISPGGKKIAYIKIGVIDAWIVISDIGPGEAKKKYFTLPRSYDPEQSNGTRGLDNTISWSGDNGSVAFACRYRGSEAIRLMDAASGTLIDTIRLPFQSIRHPYLSLDGRYVAFSAVAGGSCDIYVYDIRLKKIIRITDDDFIELNPVMSPDGRFVVYSSNRNDAGDWLHGTFRIYRHEVATGAHAVLVGGPGSSISADLLRDGNKLLFLSDRSGAWSAWVYDIQTGATSLAADLPADAGSPRWIPDGSGVVYASLHEYGYAISALTIGTAVSRDERYRRSETRQAPYPRSRPDLAAGSFDEYEPAFFIDRFSVGADGALRNGLTGHAGIRLTDMTGSHSITASSSYSKDSGRSDINGLIQYALAGERFFFGFGWIRLATPYLNFHPDDDGMLLFPVAMGNRGMDRYGGYVFIGYRLDRIFQAALTTSVTRYAKRHARGELKGDVNTVLQTVSVLLRYDGLIRGPMTPLRGFSGNLQLGQTFDLSGRRFLFTTLGIDLQGYLPVARRLVIALRGTAAAALGKTGGEFNYYLGGYSTLRGYDLLELHGKNLAYATVEFRFTMAEALKFGLPSEHGLGSLGAVLFIDAGSAWTGASPFFSPAPGKSGGVAMDFGFGLRCAVYPFLILKLDVVWPFTVKYVKKSEVLFSVSCEY